MNSSINISPTLAGFRFVINIVASLIAVVVQIDACRSAPAAVPMKDEPPSFIDPHCITSA
jgi:hypothetical protein